MTPDAQQSQRGVVFDIGGVLELTPELHTIPKWEKQLHLPPGEIGQRLNTVFEDGCYGRVSEDEVLESIQRLLGIDAQTADSFMADIWVEYLGTPNDELIAYFRALQSRCITGILSNSFVGAREREQEHLGLEGLCGHIVYSHEVGFYKPEPEIYRLTCERLGLPPQQVVLLDDSPQYIQGAREVGMHTVLFTHNKKAIQAIERWLAP
ncbi:MAG TPA: hydrolase [Deltaproteobacteria bacterium]|nr:hydrolase [Deltaproteobacteria bacterium]HCP47855.1 hydrolase [Deltaproteobacteria bacterium]